MTGPLLPGLAELGDDLLTTTPRQRRLALSRPFLGVACFVVAAWLHWWWVTPLIVFAIFVAVVTATHDVVHRTLGLDDRRTSIWLFLLGAVLLESGHAYQATHRQHHLLFPDPADPEGYPAELSFLGAIAFGPVFLARLWWWSVRRASAAGRLVLTIEASITIATIIGGVELRSTAPGLLVYAVMTVTGSWVYPLLTVYLPHHGYGDEPIHQTRTLRGRIIPALFLELTYHLEHHLYPQVPSHHLPELARRLNPYLTANGVTPILVP